MQSSKTPYGWMALGGLLCLLGLGLACKMRDGNMVHAEGPKPPIEMPLVPLPLDGNELPTGPNVDRLPTLNVPPIAVPKDMAKTVPALPSPSDVPLGALTQPRSTYAPPPPLPAMPITPQGVVPVVYQQVPTAPSTAPPLPELKPGDDPSTPQSVGTPPSPPLPEIKPIVSPPAPVYQVEEEKPVRLVRRKIERPADAPPPVTVSSPPVVPVRAESKPTEPGEPPLAPAPGPVQMYQVRLAQETLRDIARRTLGDGDRWIEIYKLNPTLKPEVPLVNGAFIRLPADACLAPEEVSEVKPLPILRPDVGPARPKVLLPLTGTYPCNLDDKRVITLPRAMRDQVGEGEIVMVSPGPDHCLWVTTQDHLERLAKRLEASAAREHEVRGFRRLYFAQTEKLTLSAEGRIQIPERLTQFAGLHQEVVLIGIDDHFELWDVARWRQYTQQKSAAARSAMSEE